MSARLTLAILGGTGDLGSGLAKCWLAAGYKVIVGSRFAGVLGEARGRRRSPLPVGGSQ